MVTSRTLARIASSLPLHDAKLLRLPACHRSNIHSYFLSSARTFHTGARQYSSTTSSTVVGPSPGSHSSANLAATSRFAHKPDASTITHRTSLAIIPDAAALAKEEIEVDLVPAQEAHLMTTARAAEQLLAIQTRSRVKNPSSSPALRIGVESGGCHGFQYTLKLADTSTTEVEDYVFHAGPNAAPIIVDAHSLPLMNGATLDYATELIGSSFRISHNPHAKDGGGCGCGVSWELA